MKKSLFDAPQFGYDEIHFEDVFKMALIPPLLVSNGVVYNSKNDFIKTNAVWDTGSDISSISSYIADKLKLPCELTGRKLNTANGLVDEKMCTTNFIVVNDNASYAFQSIEHKVRVSEQNVPSLIIGMDIIGTGKFALYHSPGFLNLFFESLR